MLGEKTTVDINRFDNYVMNILIPWNTKGGKPDLKNIGDKYQDNNEFILYTALSDAILNQIIDIIEGKDPPIVEPGCIVKPNFY